MWTMKRLEKVLGFESFRIIVLVTSEFVLILPHSKIYEWKSTVYRQFPLSGKTLALG